MRIYSLRSAAPLICLLMTGACSSSDGDDYETDNSTEMGSSLEGGEEAGGGYSVGEARADFDEDAARDAAEEEVASESYQSIGTPYGCTQDCSGHEAGFAWRRDNGYATPGNSNSFDEGGRAFDDAVEERIQEMRSDYENGLESEY